MRLMVRCVVAVSFVVTTGCASIVSHTRYPVTVDAESSGRLIVEDHQGTTYYEGPPPADLTLPASDGYFQSALYRATLYPDDGSRISRPFGGQIDLWYLGNVVFGGYIGFLIVDPATGAMWRIEPTIQLDSAS